MVHGKPQYILNLKADSNFPRGSLVDEIGVVSGFGFPILIENKTVGVMEFFSSETMAIEDRFVEVMESIGVLLGRVVERTRADEDRKNYGDHLRQLYHRLDFVREEESKRIAREVHDNLGQVLTTLKIELSVLENKLVDKGANEEESIQVMFELIEKNIEVVRKISQELRPLYWIP